MNSKSFRTGVGILALALVCGASAQSLNGIAAKKLHGGLQVQIQGEDLGKPTTAWSKSKDMYFLTFDGKLTGKPKTVRVGSNGVQAVSYAWISKKGSKVRVAMSLAKGAKPELVEKDGQWAVNFNVSEPVAKVPTTPKFPDKVPPLAKTYRNNDLQVNNSPSGNFNTAVQVDLDFVNTDIVQILKALALQSNVNIVTSPDVSGKITVTLDGVSVKDALDIVTALGGVRYAKVGNTYVVTSNGKFAETIQQISGKGDLSNETRLIPLRSKHGEQIRAAIQRSIPPSTISGHYQILSESDTAKFKSIEETSGSASGKIEASAGTGGSTASVAVEGEGTKTKTKAFLSSGNSEYLIIVGTPGRVDEVEKAIKEVDRQICASLGIKYDADQGIVHKAYEVKAMDAEDLLKALTDSKFLDGENNPVKMFASPKNSAGKQILTMSGPAGEVDIWLKIAEGLDSFPDPGSTYFDVVGIKYAKPQVILAQLLGTFPNLKGSLMPAPVDPMVGIGYRDNKLSTEAESSQKGTQNGNQGNGDQMQIDKGQASSQGGSSPVGTWLTKDNIAAALALGEVEIGGNGKSNSVPMKLILRGNREQLTQARQFIEMIDVAPKQVAVEVRVMELTKEDALKIGLDWSLITGGTLTNIRVNQGMGAESSAGGLGGQLGFKGGGAAVFTGMLDSLAGKNKMLSRPNLLATDGVPSTVFVGDTVRYVKSIQSTQNGTTVVTDEINIGVDFALIARVGDGGNISVELNPVLSVLQGFTDVPGGGQLPQTSVRSARMQVNIASGETIAIGGLIQEQDKKTYGGIPILKDLPIIGQLFGRTDNRKVRSEVVFFVTVKEVTQADRQGTANPKESERTNKDWPGNNGNGNGKGN